MPRTNLRRQIRPQSPIFVPLLLCLTLVHCNKKSTRTPAPAIHAPSAQQGAATEATVEGRPQSETKPTYSQVMFQSQKEWLKRSENPSRANDSGSSGGFSSHWCDKEVDCRKFVVMVHIDGVGTCTGVMVTPQILMTNRHCIEPLQTKTYSGLSRQVLVVIPAEAKDKPSRDVFGDIGYATQLIGISPSKAEFSLAGMGPDYAFLELNEKLRNAPVVKLNFDGIQEGETYFIYGVSPYGDSEDRQAIERRECKAVYKTTIAPYLDAAKDPMIIFGNCPIGPSNSGSPIYNKADELVGIIGGQINPKGTVFINIFGKDIFKVINPSTRLGEIGWGTNLACIPDIRDLSKQIPAECDQDLSHPVGSLKMAEATEVELRGKLESVEPTDKKYRYNIQPIVETEHLTMWLTPAVLVQVPKCIERSALETVSVPDPIDLNYAGSFVSSFWQLTSRTTEVQSSNFALSYDIASLKKTGVSELEILVGKAQKFRVHRGQIKVCN